MADDALGVEVPLRRGKDMPGGDALPLQPDGMQESARRRLDGGGMPPLGDLAETPSWISDVIIAQSLACR